MLEITISSMPIYIAGSIAARATQCEPVSIKQIILIPFLIIIIYTLYEKLNNILLK